MASRPDSKTTATPKRSHASWSLPQRLLLVGVSSVPLLFASALEWFKGIDGIGTVSFVALSAIGYLLAMYGRMPDEFNVAGHSAKFTTEQRLEVQAVLDEMSAQQLEEIACDGSDEMRELASDALDFRDRARAYLEEAASLEGFSLSKTGHGSLDGGSGLGAVRAIQGLVLTHRDQVVAVDLGEFEDSHLELAARGVTHILEIQRTEVTVRRVADDRELFVSERVISIDQLRRALRAVAADSTGG